MGKGGSPLTVHRDFTDDLISQVTAKAQLPHSFLTTTTLQSSGNDSSLIMEASLSNNMAEDQFTVYHMDFNPLTIGPLLYTHFFKAFQI